MYNLISFVFFVAAIFVRSDIYRVIAMFIISGLFAIAGSIGSHTAMMEEFLKKDKEKEQK